MRQHGIAPAAQEQPQQRANRINAVLTSCLNWQEAFSITVANMIDLDWDVNGTVYAKWREVNRAATSKRDFLQDALIYSLRSHEIGGPADDVDFEFWQTISDTIGNDVNYFCAMAIAKLFRAHMRTRSGALHGMAWGQRFPYSNAERTSVFVDRRNISAAAVLAVRLLPSANSLITAYDNCDPDEQCALRSAVLRGRPCNPDALLRARKIGLRNGLPMDKLWDWTPPNPCVYAEHCIGYDEFCEAIIAENPSAKIAMLHAAENEYMDNEHTKLIARNWWSCGFASGLYCWTQDVQVNRELHEDVESLVACIDADATYERLAEARDREHAKEMTRTACKGEKPNQIMQLEALQESYTLDAIYTTLFVIATTNTNPKLQDCWRRR